MQKGRCQLCGATGKLHDSHFLARAGYKRMRAVALKNPNPVVIAGGKLRQSSLQVRDYKFCSDCEGRFNKGGESWVLANIPEDDCAKFSIHDILNKSQHRVVEPGRLLFPESAIAEIELVKLTYFGVSIFWRGTL